jgi:PDZ domain-containing protein
MTPPKHLWSGEWRAESAAAAQDLARRRGQPPEPGAPDAPAQRPEPPVNPAPPVTPAPRPVAAPRSASASLFAPPPPTAPLPASAPPPRPAPPPAALAPPRAAFVPPRPSVAEPSRRRRLPPYGTPEPRPRRPSALTGARARLRAALARPRTRRIGLITALAALLIAAGAYGVSSVLGSGSTAPAAAPASGGAPAAWLGMEIQALPFGGVVVVTVAPGSPAEQAGLEPGDEFVQINGRPINSPADISAAISGLQPGDQIQIEISRGSAFFTTQATLAAQPSSSP